MPAVITMEPMLPGDQRFGEPRNRSRGQGQHPGGQGQPGLGDKHRRPRQRALDNDYTQEPERRNLQKEARAHIKVQRLIDRGEAPAPAVSTEFILWIRPDSMAKGLQPSRRSDTGRPCESTKLDGKRRRKLSTMTRLVHITPKSSSS
jgi:hypothetical protein